MNFGILQSMREWFSELTLIKKILLAIPMVIVFVFAVLWSFAKFCANPEKATSDPVKDVFDEEITKAKKRSRQHREEIKIIRKEIDAIHKRGEIDANDYNRLKADLDDAGGDISRVNTVLARAREQRNRRTDR